MDRRPSAAAGGRVGYTAGAAPGVAAAVMDRSGGDHAFSTSAILVRTPT